MARVMNFSAGPAALPLPALEQAQAELLDYRGSGMSIMEQSHRGKEYDAVHEEAIALLRELLAIPGTHDVLFLQGGASQQFAQVPMNLLPRGGKAAYVLSGAWGEKAFAEAKSVAAMLGGEAFVSATSGTGEGKEKQYASAPLELNDAGASYTHLTSNETIHGVQYAQPPGADFPAAQAPLVCDMSSDFLWKPVDVSRFGAIYAGAQKNIGPSGVLVLILRKDLVAGGRKEIPKIFQYRTHAEANSLYNTPPTFGIYLMRNVLQWAKGQGGLAALERTNRAKAAAVYRAIDASGGFYRCPVAPAFRSAMNVVFRLGSEALEEQFVAEAKKAGMVGLKGHRALGGVRASLYNAVPLAWAEALASFMGSFAKARG